MILLASFIFFATIPMILIAFAVLPPRRAAVGSIVAAWLFGPPLSLDFLSLPPLTKVSSATIGIILGTILFDLNRIAAFRPRWYDLPMVAWCIAPFISSVANGLGPYDGFSETLQHLYFWWFPYFIGRIYFNCLDGLQDLATGMVIGGLIYAPLCLYELRMGPRVMLDVYGIQFGDFAVRFGVLRARLFLATSLELGMWMGITALLAFWMWISGAVRQFWFCPPSWAAAILFVTSILCRTSGAILLMLAGMAVLSVSAWKKGKGWALPVVFLLLIPPLYEVSRILNLWSGAAAVDLASTYINADRAQSLEFRFFNEDTMVERALIQPVFGWAGWDRMHSFCVKTGRNTIPDGLWIIAFGTNGAFGMTSLTLASILPTILLLRRYPVSRWREPEVGAAAALAVVLALIMIDNLLNAMLDPMYAMAIGGLTALPAGEAAKGGRGKRGTADARSEEARRFAGRAEAMASVGRVAEADRDYRAALAIWEEIAAHWPDASSARRELAGGYEGLGRVLQSAGRGPEAAQVLRHALSIREATAADFPGESACLREWADSLNDLAWAMAHGLDPSQDPSRAVDLASRAIDLEPNRAAFWNTLGVSYYRGGAWSQAVAALEESVRRAEGPDGPHAIDLFFLAMAYGRGGDLARARDCFERGAAWADRNARGRDDVARLRDEAAATLETCREIP